METIKMWDSVPGMCEEEPVLEFYPADQKTSAATVIVFPGGGYSHRAPHEGQPFAEFFNSLGMNAFVCQYRVSPHRFPLELLDARRAVRYVRYHAEKFGIDPNRVGVMGSSAGGHLSALVSTYTAPIDFENIDEIDKESPIPNATILCYAVIHHPDEMEITHRGSYRNLLGTDDESVAKAYSPDLLVYDTTPMAFIWHTMDDQTVDVRNSYLYASALKAHNISHELHVFPNGRHGLGLASAAPHVAQWTTLLKNWLIYIGWAAEYIN